MSARFVAPQIARVNAKYITRAGDGIPTLLGNVNGGVSLVAFLNHAQVVAGKAKQIKPSVNRR